MTETIEWNMKIILSIKEGKNFDQVFQPTLLIGTLNGYSLESHKIEACPNPQYNSDLIWITNKTAVKKMRSEQTSLKLECFALKSNGKERIGYVMLKLRSAQVISHKDGCVSPAANWFKLLGLRKDFKMQKPKLLIALKIEETKDIIVDPVTEVEYFTIDNNIILRSDEIIPYIYPDEQLIQLGPLSQCYELFMLNITATCTRSLDALLAEYSNKYNSVCFSYQILKNSIELKPLNLESKTPYVLEKVVVRIRSSLSVLKHYLRLNPDLLIFLMQGNNVIAKSSVNLQSLIPVDNLQEFLECTGNATTTLYEQCFLNKQNSTEKLVENQHEKPYINLQIKLEYIGNKTNILNFDTATNYNKCITYFPQCNKKNMDNIVRQCPAIESDKNPNDDFKNNLKKDSNKLKYKMEFNDDEYFKWQRLRYKVLESCINKNDSLVNHYNKNYNDRINVSSYNCYRLQIKLVTIALVSPKLSGRQIEFRFHHPIAEAITSSECTTIESCDMKFDLDIECPFYFISEPDKIRQLLRYSPKISIYDVNETNKLLSQLVLDVKPLFDSVKPKCEYTLSVFDTDDKKIAEMDVMLILYDIGPLPVLTIDNIINNNTGLPMLHDNLVYDIVDELETWKERQKEIFKTELKKKEERHLNMLSEEWHKYKENLESNFAFNVEKCKMLTNSLSNASEALKRCKTKMCKYESRLQSTDGELQRRYTAKMHKFKNMLHATQQNFKAKVTEFEKKKISLEDRIKTLEHDNANIKLLLKNRIDESSKYQMNQFQMYTMQNMKILEEQLKQAMKSKEVYKELWNDEINARRTLKSDYQQAIESQIEKNKEELNVLKMQADLCLMAKDMYDDKICLSSMEFKMPFVTSEEISNQT
ncbi:uncharacterized protein LOC105433041 [Pogonomyrmex barbatus]|uniref:Uncharacterized protein LOC105433041 n=1 Tax=Pogonomyrmex barbatus TaxID=144034 RepID=A0A6I9XKR3_9HYME|nr:uncharacterized protein LOC105433041 [Pogonomyrmex barbatus]